MGVWGRCGGVICICARPLRFEGGGKTRKCCSAAQIIASYADNVHYVKFHFLHTAIKQGVCEHIVLHCGMLQRRIHLKVAKVNSIVYSRAPARQCVPMRVSTVHSSSLSTSTASPSITSPSNCAACACKSFTLMLIATSRCLVSY